MDRTDADDAIHHLFLLGKSGRRHGTGKAAPISLGSLIKTKSNGEKRNHPSARKNNNQKRS